MWQCIKHWLLLGRGYVDVTKDLGENGSWLVICSVKLSTWWYLGKPPACPVATFGTSEDINDWWFTIPADASNTARHTWRWYRALMHAESKCCFGGIWPKATKSLFEWMHSAPIYEMGKRSDNTSLLFATNSGQIWQPLQYVIRDVYVVVNRIGDAGFLRGIVQHQYMFRVGCVWQIWSWVRNVDGPIAFTLIKSVTWLVHLLCRSWNSAHLLMIQRLKGENPEDHWIHSRRNVISASDHPNVSSWHLDPSSNSCWNCNSLDMAITSIQIHQGDMMTRILLKLDVWLDSFREKKSKAQRSWHSYAIGNEWTWQYIPFGMAAASSARRFLQISDKGPAHLFLDAQTVGGQNLALSLSKDFPCFLPCSMVVTWTPMSLLLIQQHDSLL